MVDYNIQQGGIDRGIRSEVIDSLIKQTAQRSYKFKQACAESATNSWVNTFMREDPAVLSEVPGNATKGLPRGAAFPQSVVKWEEVSVRIFKFGKEANILWEDILAGNIDVQARTTLKITETVVKAVDDYILDVITESQAPSRIQSYAITLGRYWTATSAAIMEDFLNATRLIANANYDTSDLMCFVSPTDKVNICSYLVGKGSQFPTVAADVLTNGAFTKLAGIGTFIASVSVPASYAIVLKPRTCATLKQLVPLQSTTKDDPYKSRMIRVVEECVVELTDPLAVCLIKGTKAP
jgi:hypothetical protein